MEPPASHPPCGLCGAAAAPYTCPRCNRRLCSLRCYRAHGGCSEAFYREQVLQTLRSHRGPPPALPGLGSALRRPRQLREAEASAGRAGRGVWGSLSAAERAAFQRLIRTGEAAEWIPAWRPWWWRRNQGENADEDEAIAATPAVPPAIPTLSSFAAPPPSPLLRFQLPNVLFGYVFALSLHGGDEALVPELPGAALDVAAALRTRRVFGSTARALRAARHDARDAGYPRCPLGDAGAVLAVAELLEGPGGGTGDCAQNRGNCAQNGDDCTQNRGNCTQNRGNCTQNRGNCTQNRGNCTQNGDDCTQNGDDCTQNSVRNHNNNPTQPLGDARTITELLEGPGGDSGDYGKNRGNRTQNSDRNHNNNTTWPLGDAGTVTERPEGPGGDSGDYTQNRANCTQNGDDCTQNSDRNYRNSDGNHNNNPRRPLGDAGTVTERPEGPGDNSGDYGKNRGNCTQNSADCTQNDAANCANYYVVAALAHLERLLSRGRRNLDANERRSFVKAQRKCRFLMSWSREEPMATMLELARETREVVNELISANEGMEEPMGTMVELGRESREVVNELISANEGMEEPMGTMVELGRESREVVNELISANEGRRLIEELD